MPTLEWTGRAYICSTQSEKPCRFITDAKLRDPTAQSFDDFKKNSLSDIGTRKGQQSTLGNSRSRHFKFRLIRFKYMAPPSLYASLWGKPLNKWKIKLTSPNSMPSFHVRLLIETAALMKCKFFDVTQSSAIVSPGTVIVGTFSAP